MKIWNKNFVDAYNNMQLISLKYWITILISVCIIISILYIFNRKLTYIILGVSTMLQMFDMIEFLKLNMGFFIQESITNSNYIPIIFQCTNGIVVYILYWILFINPTKSKSQG